MNNRFKAGWRQWLPSQKVIALVLLGGLYNLPAQAQTNLNLKQALELTLNDNIELKAYPLIIRGAEAMKLQADLTPNPIIGIEIENALGSGNFKSLDSTEISLSYSQLIELGNKQENRLEFASADTQRLQSEYQLARLDILAETGRRYYQNIALQEQRVWITRRLKSENEALITIKRRAKAGAVGEADVSKMELRLARSIVQQDLLNAQLKQAQFRLTSMWMAEPDFDLVAGSFRSIPEIPSREVIVQSVDKLPKLKYQLALQRLADTRLQLTHSNGQSDMTFSIGVKQHQLSNDQSLNFSFSMPLAFKNSNRGRIKAALVDVEKNSLQTNWLKSQLKLTLLDIRQQLVSLESQVNSIKNKLLPQAKKLLVETKRGYQKGRYSVLQWTDAQSELFSIERSLIEIHHQYYLQFLELERITGQSMTTISAPLTGDKQ